MHNRSMLTEILGISWGWPGCWCTCVRPRLCAREHWTWWAVRVSGCPGYSRETLATVWSWAWTCLSDYPAKTQNTTISHFRCARQTVWCARFCLLSAICADATQPQQKQLRRFYLFSFHFREWNTSPLCNTSESGVKRILSPCALEQPDLDLNAATIHKHPFLWAIISKTKLIWSINLIVLENEQ